MGDLKALETRKEQLQADLQEPVDVEPLFHPNLAEIYRQKVADLGCLLEDPTTKAEAFDLIRSLIEVIRLVPGGGELEVEPRGALADILALRDERKSRTLSDPAFVCRGLNLVAGTRNHLELLLLWTGFLV